MAKKRKGWESGRKAGSTIDEPVGPARKSKSKKQKKQSKGKHKR